MPLFRRPVSLGMVLLAIVVSVFGASLITLYTTRGSVSDAWAAIAQPENRTQPLSYGAWPALGNADYFAKIRASFMSEKKDFIEADLSAMRLRVFKAGVEVLEVPIKTKGREGSWWETPSGLYRAEGKERTHFSSIGKVYMPWSIPFQGNFFIHGWPYHEDGTPVASSFSGGCIRLADPDAEAVYDAVVVGMPVLVYEKDFSDDAFTYRIDGPAIAAKSYLAADLKNNFVLLSAEASTPRENTLLEKLMTALVSSEYQDIEKRLTVTSSALVPSPHPRLASGERYRVYDLLHPLLLEDSGEAAEALAEPLGRRRFIALMAAKAQAIGVAHAVFKSPSGAEGGGRASAEDFFAAAKYLYHNRPFILNMSAGKAKRDVYGAPVFTDLQQVHPFYGEKDFLGGLAEALSATSSGRVGKGAAPAAAGAAVALAFATATAPLSSSVGEMAASSTTDLFAVFDLSFGGKERPVAFIVLDSPDPQADIAAMRAYVSRMYR